MSRRVITVSLICIIAFAAATRKLRAADYHFSALGSDLTGDGSFANPWQSIGKLNSLNLDPGDSVLFRAGDTFAGNIVLDQDDSANNASGVFGGIPIRLTSYGTGSRPIISTPSGHGLWAANAGGLEIAGLEFAGAATVAAVTNIGNSSRGLFFENSQTTFRQQHIRVQDVVVHGFGEAGIHLHAMNPTIASGGFADVEITGSEIYQNGRSGIVSSASSTNGLVVGGSEYDFYARAHADLRVANNVVRNTTGKSESGGVSGNGIVLAQVDGALIERNVAHHNGGVAGGGGVGIWVWEASNATIQFNEAYNNQTFDGRDGGGFDLDGGVRNSVMQYNYSHGNEGAGLGLFQFGYASDMIGNTIRYNISEADGAGIAVWGSGPRFPGQDVADDSIYHNNTIINPNGPATHFFGTVDDIGLYNNILVTDNGRPLVQLDDWDGNGTDYTLDVDFRGNAYWSSGDPFLVNWRGTNYVSLVAWANATGQEKIAGSLVGIQGDPLLAGPFNGGETLDDPELLETLAAYRLLANSPLIDAGVDLAKLPLPISLGLTNLGSRHFYGTNLPVGAAIDIGVHEASHSGDFNRDGLVDAADYTVWRNYLGTNFNLNGNGDETGSSAGIVDAADYALWKSQYGATVFGAGRGSLVVPEPTGCVILLVGLSLRRRIRRQRKSNNTAMCGRHLTATIECWRGGS